MSETKELPASGNGGGQSAGSPVGSPWAQAQSTTTTTDRQAKPVEAVNQVDRIDFFETAQGLVVIKFKHEPGSDRPAEQRQHGADFDLEAALTWCEEHGFTVRRWPGGARAWRGSPWPIRTRAEVFRKRREMEKLVWEELRLDPHAQLGMQSVLACDFLYDC